MKNLKNCFGLVKGKRMKISNDHVKNVCQPATKNCCAYLSMGAGGWHCCKVNPAEKSFIDARLAAGRMNATCDNCDGPNVPRKVLN